MRHYKDITYYENRRRLEKLTKFRHDVVFYFRHSRIDEILRIDYEDEEARKIRPEINQTLIEIRRIFFSADMISRIQYTPPPSIGGHIQNVDILDNVFALQQWGIDRQQIIDALDRAIGVYESDFQKSVIRTFNPFWWGLRVLELIAYLPLRIWGAIGFDLAKAEQSVLGKLSKLIVPVAGILQILHLMGCLDTIKRALGIDP